jgi:hypothetical protein
VRPPAHVLLGRYFSTHVLHATPQAQPAPHISASAHADSYLHELPSIAAGLLALLPRLSTSPVHPVLPVHITSSLACLFASPLHVYNVSAALLPIAPGGPTTTRWHTWEQLPLPLGPPSAAAAAGFLQGMPGTWLLPPTTPPGRRGGLLALLMDTSCSVCLG